MTSLVQCVKKAGKALSKSDIKALKTSHKKYIDGGMTKQEATIRSVEDFVMASHDKVTGYEKEIMAKGGDAKAKDFNLTKVMADIKTAPPVETAIDKAIGQRKGDKPIGLESIARKQRGSLGPLPKDNQFTPVEEAVIKKGGFGRRPPAKKIKDRVEEIATNAKTKFRQSLVDQFASFKHILKDDKSHMLANLTASAPGALEASVHTGRIFLDKEGVVGVDPSKNSLSQVMEPLGKDVDKWTYWIAGNRANKLKAEGKENLFEQEDIDVLMGMNKGNEKAFETARIEFEKLGDAINQIGVKTGLINAEEARQWKEEGFYLPFYRILSEGESKGPRVIGNAGLVRQQAYKKLKGGTQQLDDLLANSVLNWNHLISASLKNQAGMKAMETAVELGIAREVPKANAGKNAIYLRRDGKEVWFEVDDDLVLDSMNSLNWEGLNGDIMKASRAFKRALTIGVTASPEFKIANLIRDSIQAVATTEVSTNIAKNLYQGWKATSKDSPISAAMLAGGGTFGQSGYIHGADPDAIKKLVAKGVDEATILDTKNKFKVVWDAYQDFGARLENVNRAADYAQAIADGESNLKAMFGARDHLDFTRTGSATWVRALAQVVPFLNARLQGLDKLARAAPDTAKGWLDPKEAAKFKTVIATYSIASIGLFLAMKDDEDYKALEEWEVRTYHPFKVPGNETMFFIPRPFEVGAIAFLAESMVHQMVSDKAHGQLFAERLGHTLTDTFSFNPVPQIIKPGLEVALNKSSFTGRAIESPHVNISNLSPVRRKRVWTSETAIAMSQGMDKISWGKVVLSPIQIEHLVRGYLGWAGASTLAATDMLITRPLTDAPTQPPMKWSEYPIVKRFVKTMPARNTRFTSEFYDKLKEINVAFTDIRDAKKLGEIDEAREMALESKDLLKLRPFYKAQQKKISKINKRMRLIMASSMEAEEKGREIDRLTVFKNQITKRIADKTEVFEKQTKK